MATRGSMEEIKTVGRLRVHVEEWVSHAIINVVRINQALILLSHLIVN